MEECEKRYKEGEEGFFFHITILLSKIFAVLVLLKNTIWLHGFIIDYIYILYPGLETRDTV